MLNRIIKEALSQTDSVKIKQINSYLFFQWVFVSLFIVLVVHWIQYVERLMNFSAQNPVWMNLC